MNIEEKNSVEVVKESDVVVVGGGLAGVAAAVAARRCGASVTLIEKSIVLGGLATLGHVCIYLPIDDGAGHKVFGGLAEELLHVCIKYGYDNLPDCWRDKPDTVEDPDGRYQTNFNIPAAVLALDELVQSEGVEVVFDTVFSAPIMEGNTCKGIIVENKSGRTAYMGKMFIDASGDSDLLFRAGAECETQDNIVSHWAHELDFETMKAACEDGKMVMSSPLRWLGLRPDVDNTDSKLPMFDGTTSDGVNGFIKLSRGLALEYLKQHQDEGYSMMTLPFMPQFRMTRRLIGKKELVVEAGRHEDHSIGCVIFCLEAPARVYEFPYEGLINDTLTNIAAAGRMVSAGGRGWEIMRFIPACVLTGQAAGTAAALAIQSGTTLQGLDVAMLQKRLEADGVLLHSTAEMAENEPGKYKVNPKATKGNPTVRADALSYSDLTH
ncbi:MAG: FAD-dependent oxidoreductase [Parasporobacterium sp.]|nr:FAD-dependent oxidoreductase [Parasporobacterium sp.]